MLKTPEQLPDTKTFQVNECIYGRVVFSSTTEKETTVVNVSLQLEGRLQEVHVFPRDGN
jgi:hypothetical protein